MREQRNDPKRLKDILQAIDTIIQYVDGRDMETFLEHTGSGVSLCANSKKLGEVTAHGVRSAVRSIYIENRA